MSYESVMGCDSEEFEKQRARELWLLLNGYAKKTIHAYPVNTHTY